MSTSAEAPQGSDSSDRQDQQSYSSNSSLEILINFLNIAGDTLYSKLVTVVESDDGSGNFSISGSLLYDSDYIKTGIQYMLGENDNPNSIEDVPSVQSSPPDSHSNKFPELKELKTRSVKDGFCGVSIIRLDNSDDSHHDSKSPGSESIDRVIRRDSEVVLVHKQRSESKSKSKKPLSLGTVLNPSQREKNQNSSDTACDNDLQRLGSSGSQNSDSEESESSDFSDSDTGTEFLERNFQVMWHFIPHEAEPCLKLNLYQQLRLVKDSFHTVTADILDIHDSQSHCYCLLSHHIDIDLILKRAGGWGVVLNWVVIRDFVGKFRGGATQTVTESSTVTKYTTRSRNSDSTSNSNSKFSQTLVLPSGTEKLWVEGGTATIFEAIPATVRTLVFREVRLSLNEDADFIKKSHFKSLANLTHLHLDCRLTSSSDPREVVEEKNENSKGDLSFLPPSLTTLALGRPGAIDPSTLPPKLKKLLSYNCRFLEPGGTGPGGEWTFPPRESQSQTVITLPETLEDLHLNHKLEEIFYPKHFTVSLPKNLRKLYLKGGFNGVIRDGAFSGPESDSNKGSHRLSQSLGESESSRLRESDSKLEVLSLAGLYRFNQALDDICMLPDSLRELIFGAGFDQPLHPDHLPSGLKKLVFGKSFNQNLLPNTLPRGLEHLEFGSGFSFIPSSSTKDSDVLPPGLKILKFESLFLSNYSQPDRCSSSSPSETQSNSESNERLSLSSPRNETLNPFQNCHSLQVLHLGTGFNRELKGLLSHCFNLKELVIGFTFDQEIKVGDLPRNGNTRNGNTTNLEKLELGYRFNNAGKQLKIGVFPVGLKEISFGARFNQPLPLGLLPDGLEYISFGSGSEFNQELEVGVFPSTVREIEFKDSNEHLRSESSTFISKRRFERDLVPGVFPLGIEKIHLPEKFNRKLRVGVFPPGVKVIKLGREYNQPITDDQPMIEFASCHSHSESVDCDIAPVLDCVDPDFHSVKSEGESDQAQGNSNQVMSSQVSVFPGGMDLLTFGGDFNQLLKKNSFPHPAPREIRFGEDFDQKITLLGVFGDRGSDSSNSNSDTSLSLSGAGLTGGLKVLSFGRNFSQKVDEAFCRCLPEGIEKLCLGFGYPHAVMDLSLAPRGLREVCMDGKFLRKSDSSGDMYWVDVKKDIEYEASAVRLREDSERFQRRF